MDLIYSVVGFFLAISILVFIHELGHFAVARLFKVRVLKFSIGFGPAYRIGCDKFGTEYLISAIPLGGYVQLLDYSADFDPSYALATTEKNQAAINLRSPLVRIAILAGGPLFNLIFALLVYFLVFVMGIASNLPIVGKVNKGSIAEIAGLRSGLQIKKIANHKVNDWEEVAVNILKGLTSNSKQPLLIETYEDKLSKPRYHYLNLRTYFNQGDVFKNLGLEPFIFMDHKIWQIVEKYPAAKAGLKPGDVIVSLDEVSVQDPYQVFDYVYDKAGKTIKVKVLRAGNILSFNLQPVLKSAVDPIIGAAIGVQYRNMPYPKELTIIKKYPWQVAWNKAFSKTYNEILLSSYFLISMVKGKLSLSNTAGPLAIGYYAGQSMRSGLEYFLNFLATVSINLGILNLLPIPWLDGGAIIHCIYELVMRKPIHPKVIYWGKSISLVLLIALAITIFINDLIKL